MKNILYLILLIALSGCITQEKCNAKFPCLGKDTTITNTVTKDSTVFIPPDESWLWALVSCDSTNQVLVDSINILKGKKSNITYTIKDNPNGKGKIVYIDCHCDSANIALKWNETHKTTTTNKTQVLPPKESKLSGILKIVMWILLILGIMYALSVIYRLFKK